jgi:hypothetical protein
MRRTCLALTGGLALLLATSSLAMAHATMASTSGELVSGERLGRLRLSPASGPAGTSINVTPTDPCTPPTGLDRPRVRVHLDGLGEFVGQPAWQPIAEGEVRVGAGGAWTATVRVPAGTRAGQYKMTAECWDPRNTAEDALPYFEYSRPTFTVTGEPVAPPPAVPAQPVPGTPAFTG